MAVPNIAPNIDRAGNPKTIYFTDRFYSTAGRAKTHLQLPEKPAYRVEIRPEYVADATSFEKIARTDNPRWGLGGGTQATTTDAIKVDPATLTPLKGGKIR